MADISTKDGSGVKKIHLNSTDRRPARNTVSFLGPPFGELVEPPSAFCPVAGSAPSSVHARVGVESG